MRHRILIGIAMPISTAVVVALSAILVQAEPPRIEPARLQAPLPVAPGSRVVAPIGIERVRHAVAPTEWPYPNSGPSAGYASLNDVPENVVGTVGMMLSEGPISDLVRARNSPSTIIFGAPPAVHLRDGQACSFEGLDSGHRLLAFVGYDPQMASSAYAAIPQERTGAAEIAVQQGAEPLYIVLDSFGSTVWTFTGALERIAGVVVGGMYESGVVGIEQDKVHFVPQDCLDVEKWEAEQDDMKVRFSDRLAALAGRPADVVRFEYAFSTIALPELSVSGIELGPIDDMPVRSIDPTSIVSMGAPGAYPVLPGRAGIQQLLREGAIVASQNEMNSYVVRRAIDLPPALYQVHKFVVPEGVPMPNGDPGHACILAEDGSYSINRVVCSM